MTSIDIEIVKKHVLKRLAEELPPDLYFHGIHHTRDRVLPAAEHLAKAADLSEEDTLLLRTAALYHDLGYVEQYDVNEPIAVRIAEEELPGFGYQPEQIDIIKNIIMATQLPQNPQTLLEQLMCDADLDGLGSDEFYIISHSLWLELQKVKGLENTLKEWYLQQVDFMKSHKYHSAVARARRDAAKEKYLKELQEILS